MLSFFVRLRLPSKFFSLVRGGAAAATANEGEERAVERELEFQLNEQKASLDAVADALSSNTSNTELLSVHSELVQAIKDAEEGLFQLKWARLLREADYALQGSLYHDDVSMEPIPTGVEAEPLADHSYSIGSKYRFRYSRMVV